MTAPSDIPDSMLLPTVSVWADGVWVADGRDPDSDEPQALDGLVIRWGRSTVVDQPQPSTCSLTLIDRAGGTRFLDLLQLGGRLDVRADALITSTPDPDTGTGQVVISEEFEAGVGNTWAQPAGAARLTTAAGGTTGQALRLDTLTDQAVLVVVPPGPRQPVGGDPTAWDGIPRAVSGETWALTADVHLPAAFAGWADWAAELVPVTFTSPWDVPHPQELVTSGSVDVGGGYRRLSGTVLPPQGSWVGMAVRFWPIGPAWDDLDASTWDDLAADPTTWDDLGRMLVDRVRLNAPAAGALRQGMVFSGRITDMEARFDAIERATLVDVTAADQRAELGSRDVGDQPWLAETLGSRFQRIVDASGQPIQARVSDTAAAYQVSWRDVDRQPAIVLLSELATSADGVLWAATHPTTGPYLELESLADRPPMFILAKDPDGVVRIRLNDPAAVDAIEVSACDVLLEPVRWRHDIEDMATRVAITWRDQTLDQDGQPAPTDRTETVTNPVLEGEIGVHRVAVSTQLAVQADAQLIADAVLGRTSNTQWRVGGLTWRADTTDQLDADALTRMMTLLDGTTRNGLPIMLTDLPAWTPIPGDQVGLFLEGGTYSSEAGSWVLDLVVSSARATGDSAVWDDLDPAWQWDQFDPAITWNSLHGVSVP